jgi:hypothetical protein
MYEVKTIKLYNEFHLGDHIFNFILFNNIKNYIENNNIIVEYYCEKQYHEQLSEFNYSKNIHILDYVPGNDNGFHLWIGNKEFENNRWYKIDTLSLDVIYVMFFNEFLQKQNIPIVIEKLEYKDPDLQNRYSTIDTKYNSKYSNLDFLILNSTPRSNQYVKDETKWNNLINKLNEKFKVVTSEKVEGVNCTCDDKLTVKDIQAISSHSKKIIAVSSGVITVLFNSDTLNNVETIYSFSNVDKYDHPKIISKENIDDMYSILNIEEGFQNLNVLHVEYSDLLITVLILPVFAFISYNTFNWIRFFKKTIGDKKRK